MTTGFLSRHPMFFRVLGLVATVTTLHACMAYQRTSDQPTTVVARGPDAIRIHLAAGQSVTLFNPFIVGDSLGGYVGAAASRERFTVPLSDVRSTDVLRVSAGRTLVFVAMLGATVVLIVGAVGREKAPPAAPAPGPGPIASCPLVYGWDGTAWQLVSGTFAGAIARPLQRTVVEVLDSVAPQDGTLRLKVTNEMDETDYLDAVEVLAVDLEPGLAVASDPAGRLHAIGALVPPVRATDFRGADALPRVHTLDGWGWESSLAGRDTSRLADLRDGLQLAFVRPAGAARAHLVLDASSTPWAAYLLPVFFAAHGAATDVWYDSLNTQPALARALAMRLAGEAFLAASVRTPSGWAGASRFWLVGPERAGRQVLDVDLSQITGDTVYVRLESAPALWLVDRVAMDFTADRALTVDELPLLSARDWSGRDVAPLLAAADGTDYVLQPGDAAELSFRVPEPGAGTSRTLLLRTAGWYRVIVPAVDPPDVAILDAVMHAPLGISRAAVAQLNLALARLSPAAGAPGTVH